MNNDNDSDNDDETHETSSNDKQLQARSLDLQGTNVRPKEARAVMCIIV